MAETQFFDGLASRKRARENSLDPEFYLRWANGMNWQITQFSDVGTANPIVARLTMGLFDIIQMARIIDEKKERIKESCFEVHSALIQAEKAAKPLMDEIKGAEQKLATEGVKTQSGGRVIEIPPVLLLENSRTFLKYANQALRNLAAGMGAILDHDFKGPHFHKIRDKAKTMLGDNHIVSRLLTYDQGWIKEINDLRNEDEHPASGKAFVKTFEITRLPNEKFLVQPPKFFNDAPVLNRLEIFSHNLLTFSEEMIAHSLSHFFPPMVAVFDIPEDQRNPDAPVRYRLGLKEGAPQPGHG